MATREELEQKINKLEVNMSRTDRIVNGGEDEDVLIDGGQLVPSIRKWQKELGEEYGFPQELVQQAEDAAGRAEDAASSVEQDAERIAQDAAAKVIAGVDGAVAVAESAADRAETASNAAFVNADVKTSIEAGLTGPEAVAVGEQFQVLSEDGLEYRRYRKDSEMVAVEVGDGYPSASAPALRSFDADAPGIAHAFVDKDYRLLAHIDSDGKLHATPSTTLKEKINYVERYDGEFLFAVTDSEKKVVFHIDRDDIYYKGKSIIKGGDSGPVEAIPDAVNKTPLSSVSSRLVLSKLELIKQKLEISTIAEGGASNPPIEVNGDGLTHPSLVYVPGGWNGYEYWMAATPYFGVITSDAYENPHVFASNDLLTWVEPSGGRIDDLEGLGNGYWSDTHLAIGDDGCMHLYYRGVGLGGMDVSFAYKKSRDGVNWSPREIILNGNDQEFSAFFGSFLSPSFFQSPKGMWQKYVVATGPNIDWPDTDYGGIRRVMRWVSNAPNTLEALEESQTVRYHDFTWAETDAPWHIDACQVGNLTFHLINTSPRGTSSGQRLYLAYSSDGWNFHVLPQILGNGMYRSTVAPLSATQDHIELAMIAARTNGTMDLYKLTLEVI